jgi:hypothetical protein
MSSSSSCLRRPCHCHPAPGRSVRDLRAHRGPAALGETFTEHYRRAHPEALSPLPSKVRCDGVRGSPAVRGCHSCQVLVLPAVAQARLAFRRLLPVPEAP